MAEKATTARPYARAAFEFAHEHGQLPRFSSLLAAGAAVVSDERVARLIGHPEVGEDDLVALITEAAGEAVDEHGRNFIRTVAHNDRLALLPEIAAQYETLRAEVENVVDVELVSAMPVETAQHERLAGALKRRFGRDVRIHTRIDASLIGGAVVRAGDLVIDGSLKGRLERLSSAMAV